jgi:hypothetical protein
MMAKNAGNPSGKKIGWLARIVAFGALLGNILGLPVRLFSEGWFTGIGIFSFVIGMIVGAIAAFFVRPRLASKGAIAFFISTLVVVIVAYLLYLWSVNQGLPEAYASSWRRPLELSLYGLINFLWGLTAEIAARTTRAAQNLEEE